MDHMRSSGNEPSSVISQTKWFQEIQERRGLRDCKNGVCLKSVIYKYVKYGLMGMRYKNSNMYVVRK